MIYTRLKLARNLLRDDGVMFISIDDNEVDNLRKVCSEVFGGENFVAQIIWQKVFSPKNSAKWFSEDHDYVLVYAKSGDQWTPNLLPQTDEMRARYKNPDDGPRGPSPLCQTICRSCQPVDGTNSVFMFRYLCVLMLGQKKS